MSFNNNNDEVKDPVDRLTLSKDEPKPPEELPKKIKFNYFPQDPLIDSPIGDEIEQDKIGRDLKGPRTAGKDSTYHIAIPDLEGNFIFTPDKPGFDQVNSFVVSQRTLEMHEKSIGHQINWAFDSKILDVNSHAGEGANAYYMRWSESINFLFFKSKGLDKTVQTSQSADIVAHETGHAVLDGLRPKLLSSWNSENRAFHEAFSDCSSMLYTLQSDVNLEGIAKETSGDLTKWNRLPMMAEEFGKALRLKNDDPGDDHKTYLRNAINDFKYVKPSDLPSGGGEDQLTSEPHNFSRVFTGAFYDFIKAVYERKLAELPHLPPENPENPDDTGKPDVVGALKATRDIAGQVLLKAVDISPASDASYKTIAKCMIKADEILNNGANRYDLVNVFVSRNILKPEDIQNDRELPDVSFKGWGLSRDSLLDFLKANENKLGLKASDFTEAVAVKDTYGNTILQYVAGKEIPLNSYGVKEAAGINKDLFMDVYSSATLAFDSNGKLVSRMVYEVNQDTIWEAIHLIKDLEKKGLIRRQPINKLENIFKSSGIPYEAEVYQMPDGRFKVQRIPIVVD